nr:hypothetical protein [Bradyrhizobium prioritasuperba]
MRMILLVFAGLVLGVLVGAALGLGAGLAWTSYFETSSFEGYSGMLVFLTFMPIGAMIGGLIGAIGLGMFALRDGEPRARREP